MEQANTLLQVRDLHLQRDGREILRGINLDVRQGTVHAILGLNGSGKSTLAYTLMGCTGYAPDAGQIMLEDIDITHHSISERGQQGMTLAWQEPARFEGLTIERYIGLGMAEPDPSRIAAALAAVDLSPSYATRTVDEALSGGERKRVELAAVYAMRPKLAILDEPDSGIDALSLDDIAEVLRSMVREGTTVLVISHRDEIVGMADTASLICEGRVIETGTPDRVCDRYEKCCQPCDRREIVETEQEYERL